MTEIENKSRIQDRRAKTPFFCAYHLGIKTGRRKSTRRRVSRGSPVYVDRYANYLLFCVASILLLSAMDAFFTLNILAHGGEELNWFMDVLIKDSVAKFVGVKLALTSFALILLVIHHDSLLIAKLRLRHLILLILAAYIVLICYELYLLQLQNQLF